MPLADQAASRLHPTISKSSGAIEGGKLPIYGLPASCQLAIRSVGSAREHIVAWRGKKALNAKHLSFYFYESFRRCWVLRQA
jgi:hypothetical protein